MTISAFRAKLQRIRILTELIANSVTNTGKSLYLQEIEDLAKELEAEVKLIENFMLNFSKGDTGNA